MCACELELLSIHTLLCYEVQVIFPIPSSHQNYLLCYHHRFSTFPSSISQMHQLTQVLTPLPKVLTCHLFIIFQTWLTKNKCSWNLSLHQMKNSLVCYHGRCLNLPLAISQKTQLKLLPNPLPNVLDSVNLDRMGGDFWDVLSSIWVKWQMNTKGKGNLISVNESKTKHETRDTDLRKMTDEHKVER